MPPLAGPRLMLCWTRQPVKTWTEPSSMRTGKWTVSSRLTSRRPWRASSERPMTSAAASKRRCAVWKAEERISTAIWRLPIVTPGLRGWSRQNCLLMTRPHLATFALIALVALVTGFVLAGQIRAQLLTPSNQLARYQALVRNVQELEAVNTDDRRQIASLRAHIDALESDAAARSAAT